jgi:Xaa-Pro aminopeptidase
LNNKTAASKFGFREKCDFGTGTNHGPRPGIAYGNFHGYIGDLARMAVLGEPDAELQELLAEIEAIQRAAFAAVGPGRTGGDIYACAEKLLKQSKQCDNLEFLAHGMGLVSHEAPRLTAQGPVPYDDFDAKHPLEAGMVVSIETTLKHPRRGFIKLEDTLAVADNGYVIFGESGRGWNRGAAMPAKNV